MRKIVNGVLGAAAAVGMMMAGPAAAQSGTAKKQDTNALYSLLPAESDLTPEEMAANAEKTIIIHFMSDVTYWSALQLVIMVQDYYRNGYRKFVVPIQTVGGSISSAMYAYETLSRMPIEMSTVAVGYVDSAGVYLYCLGKKRFASPGASFLFHPMNGTVNSNRRAQEAAQTQIENLNVWVDSVHAGCFGEPPEEWDLERRDYRVLAGEAGKVGLVNAGSDYFDGIEPIGGVSYVYPTFIPTQLSGR